MPDQEFENRVQEKMAELRLPPSAPVWERVEQQLNKKEKRRRGLLWLPVFLSLLAGFYFLMDRNTTAPDRVSGNESRHSEGTLPKPQKNTLPRVATLPPSVHEQAADQKQGQPITAGGSTGEETGQPKSSDAILLKKENNVHRIARGLSTVTHTDEQTLPQAGNEASIAKEKPVSVAVDQTTTLNVEEEFSKPLVPAVVKAGSSQSATADLFSHISSPQLKTNPSTFKKSTARKTQFGIAFSIGKSNIKNGKLVNGLVPSTRDYLYVANPSNGPQSGSGFSYLPPSKLKAGLGFSIGGYMQKQVSRYLKFTTGLNYKLYNTSNTLGIARDTMFSNTVYSAQADPITKVFETGDSMAYNNKYHFLEIPLYLEGRLINGKLPLLWNAGLSVSFLVASNAMYYDNASSIYYVDNSLLNRTQFNLNLGLHTLLFQTSSHPLQIGPELSVGLSNVFKPNANPKHFMFAGIKAAVPLKMK